MLITFYALNTKGYVPICTTYYAVFLSFVKLQLISVTHWKKIQYSRYC